MNSTKELVETSKNSSVVTNQTMVGVSKANESIHSLKPSSKTLVQLSSKEYPAGNIQRLAQGYEGMFKEDRRMFPEFEEEGDYVQLKEYPGQNIQHLAQGYEGMFNEDRRMFPEFEDQGDYVLLKTNEYPAGNIQNLAQGYEGLFEQDRRMFPEFEDKGDY